MIEPFVHRFTSGTPGNPSLHDEISSRVQRFQVFREADLQFWTYLWFLKQVDFRLDRYAVFNQPYLRSEGAYPDLVFLHNGTRAIAVELKEGITGAANIASIVDDASKCRGYRDSGWLHALLVYTHDFSQQESDSLRARIEGTLQDMDGVSVLEVWTKHFPDYASWKRNFLSLQELYREVFSRP